MKRYLFCLLMFYTSVSVAQNENYVKENYTKIDTTIIMRDGIKLYTIIYVPKDSSQQYPILMQRTPYSVWPYGSSNYPQDIMPGKMKEEKYIYVKQDVRGRHMSEGINEEVTPYIPNKKSNKDVDESSDTYDTIEWLLKFLQNDNGRVGLWGISYPGFYATASLPGAHPAIKAVSPQAPVTDEFAGDDVNHNGAFFLLDNFRFMEGYDRPRPGGTVIAYKWPLFTPTNYSDAYKFFLEMKTISESNGAKYFNGKGKYWQEYLAHDTYDNYWRSRNIRPHLKNITIPTLVVGGWFDAEDLFGALKTYEAIEKQSPKNKNFLVMGTWTHGAWGAPEWKKFGTHQFGANVNQYFQDSIEGAFFKYYLKDRGNFNASEATMFETGTNQWKHFDQWPPPNTIATTYYLGANNKLSLMKNNTAAKKFSEYISDPNKPVPYTNGIYSDRNNEYMIEDQRFAATRPDVVVFETDTLTEDMTIAGPITANLFVSITGTDADFVVKLIDVLPEIEKDPADTKQGIKFAGMQRLVRAEVMRGKFRNDLSKPEPFVPNRVTKVKFELNDVLHTFKKGHRIMIQVQSSWFPLVDRNPQQFMRIPDADEKDYQKATIRIYHDATNSSKIILPVLK
jgi:putative CocE/NonD family hydrolase